MSRLLFDAGNTALKWALAADTEPRGLASGSLVLRDDWCGALALTLRTVAAGAAGSSPIGAAVGCSVASEPVMREVAAVARDAVATEPVWLPATARFDHGAIVLVNGYREPALLGADRWHAMIAARQAYAPKPLVVVCAGTATTVDWIDAGGRFIGGVIAPGFALMTHSLAAGTARLPHSAGSAVLAPDNTDDAIATGIADAMAGLVERRVRGLARLAGPAQVVLAGGHARELAARAEFGPDAAAVHIDEALVLRGLWYRAEQQAAGAAAAGANAAHRGALR
jgi:type III pantothenate kinase